MSIRNKVRWVEALCLKLFGHKIVDCYTGEFLGKSFLLVWGSRIYVLAYDGQKPLRLVWLPEQDVKYWRSRAGFTTHTEYDE